MGRLSTMKQTPDEGGTMLIRTLGSQKTRKDSAIAESPVPNNGMICNGRSSTCRKSTQSTKSLKTSAQASTLKEKALTPYWNKRVKALSKRLWLPTKIDSHDLDSILLNGLLKGTVGESWFSIELKSPPNKNSQQTFLPYFRFSLVDFTDSGDTVIRSRRIRIYPNSEQQSILRKWYGGARYVYNKTIEYLKQSNTKANWMEVKKYIFSLLPDWAKEIPYQIKSMAVKEACRAVKMAKKKFKQIGKFQFVKFRSKKKQKDTIYLPKTSVKEDGFYKTLLGKIFITEKIGEVKYDCKMMYYQGRYFLIKPEDKPIRTPENQRKKIVSLDPGVRTFQAFYSPELCGFIGGNKDFGRICRLCAYMDKLVSKISHAKGRRKYRLRKALNRMRWKIRDLISEIHHKAANFLCKNYDVIIIPTFEVSKMVVKSARKIISKTVRAMLSWCHYRFKQILKYKGELLSCKVYADFSEAYTSKTCSWCGWIDKKLSGKKIFKCKSCGMEIDRDLNGARGFYLKSVIENNI